MRYRYRKTQEFWAICSQKFSQEEKQWHVKAKIFSREKTDVGKAVTLKRTRTGEQFAIYGYVFGRSYSEAKRKKAEAMVSSPKTVRTVSDQPFMREVAYQWLDGLKTIRQKSTVAKYEGQLRNHILPEFRDKHIDEISNNDINSFSQKLLEKGKKPRTTADIISRMRAIRKFSVLHGYSVKFISDCAEIPQTFERVRVLSSEEERRLVAYLKKNLNPSNLGILISLFTGIRLFVP